MHHFSKELIAEVNWQKSLKGLDQETILNLLEQPKSSDLKGDIAFPAISSCLKRILLRRPMPIGRISILSYELLYNFLSYRSSMSVIVRQIADLVAGF